MKSSPDHPLPLIFFEGESCAASWTGGFAVVLPKTMKQSELEKEKVCYGVS